MSFDQVTADGGAEAWAGSTVADTGVGMDGSELTSAFQQFHRSPDLAGYGWFFLRAPDGNTYVIQQTPSWLGPCSCSCPDGALRARGCPAHYPRPMGTATFLFADIVGSTRLWDTHPDAMRSALAEHDEISGKVVDARGGTVFKHTGDGFIAVFESAGAAIEAAVDHQKQMAARSFPDVGPLASRMGIHTGEVEERDNDYFGPALNRTARLMSAAHGGQVLVSVVARRIAEDLPAVSFKDLGEHRLRDLSQPEQVFQVLAEGLESEFPELVTADVVPNNLPTMVSSFVGRQQEMEEVAKLLRGARVVSISGVGGAGKTRLALQVAADIGSEFPGGVWFVELAPVTDPDHVDNLVARTLGIAEVPGRPIKQLIVEFLADHHSLLIIDNCEHLIDAAATLTAAITAGAPNVRVIATTRELLGVNGEVAFGLRSLGIPSKSEHDPGEIAHFDSVRLFLERAAAAKPDYRMSAEDAASVAEICRRLDGMPLALELAAARLRTFSPSQIADNLDKRFRMLTGGSRTALPRQQTLMAAIDWSYRLLDDAERALFERLSVFQGGFALESAMDVAAGGDLDEFAVLELLPQLVDKSLVVADTTKGAERYALLETIRQFSRDRLDESEHADEFRARHAEHFWALAVEAGRNIRGPDEAVWWDRVSRELDNLRQAMTWGLEAGQPVLALRIAGAFWRYWWFTSTWSEGIEWLIRCVKAADGVAPKEVLAQGLLGWGTLMGWVPAAEGNPVEILGRALEFYRELDAEGIEREVLKRTYSAALINLAALMEITGGPTEESRELNEEALEVARRLGDAAGVAVSLGNLAEWASRMGDETETRRRFAEAVEASRALKSQQRLVEQYWQVAGSELKFGHPDRARDAYSSALAAAREGRLDQPAVISEACLALCDCDEGLEGSHDRFRRGLATVFRNPEAESDAFVRHLFVACVLDLLVKEGDFEGAARLWGASEALTEGGSVLWHEFQPRRDRAIERIVTELGDGAESQRAIGREWSAREAIDAMTEPASPTG